VLGETFLHHRARAGARSRPPAIGAANSRWLRIGSVRLQPDLSQRIRRKR
jgi:hypothetical protein